jgi:hypothetical protein
VYVCVTGSNCLEDKTPRVTLLNSVLDITHCFESEKNKY